MIGIYKGTVPDTSTDIWTLEDPDKYRGRPFKRYLCMFNHSISEVVMVPMQLEYQRHIQAVWALSFPEVYAWSQDPGEERPYRYVHILFVKTGWSGPVDTKGLR